jgi:hypothetical protein
MAFSGSATSISFLGVRLPYLAVIAFVFALGCPLGLRLILSRNPKACKSSKNRGLTVL